ncbi:MAG: ATP-dependent 6-phosphofructokinase [bacterium]
MLSEKDFMVKTLGECKVQSPLKLSTVRGDGIVDFVPEEKRIYYCIECDTKDASRRLSFEKAGPRKNIYFQPDKITAAIMTSGGLCPGLNNVIRSLVLELYYRYGVENILGIRYGHKGLEPAFGYEPVKLTPDVVRKIRGDGGSLLGTSRGAVDKETMVNSLVHYGVSILFGVGGDGSQRGLHALYKIVEEKGLQMSIIGIPKTIDNDIPYVFKTFGLDTAVTIAAQALACAHSEAESAYNGIGLVKVMGRDSGYIAAFSAIANNDVNFCLIPEVDFDCAGEGGFLDSLEKRLERRHHAVVVVAEGAGQKFFSSEMRQTDLSGNKRLKDIGVYLREEIKNYFSGKGIPIDLKYIDPSYMIRSVPTNANDAIYTDELARHAVHAAMAGKTDMMIGQWHNVLTHVPLSMVTQETKRLDIEGELWRNVLSATGQPISMKKY